MFAITPEVAADTGVHLGDGNLFIGKGNSAGTYRYEVTGHAIEDQLYVIGCVGPLVASAYNINNPTFYVNPEQTWMSLRYHNKPLALFKHEQLGLPSGKKTDAAIPLQIRKDAQLMKHFAREILATDGLLGFYNASQSRAHKYGRIQIRMTARNVIEELAAFLRNELGMSISCRSCEFGSEEPRKHPQYMIQINSSEDIEIWEREIGFSNPSHISRLMVFLELGECPPNTSITNRLSFLSGCASQLSNDGCISKNAIECMLNLMRRRFGSPRSGALEIMDHIERINGTLRSKLGRGLPEIVDD